jgi:hypothetical protein
VIPVEGWTGGQETTELLARVGPAADAAEDDLRINRSLGRLDPAHGVGRDDLVILGRLEDSEQDGAAGHHALMPKGGLQLVLPALDHLDRDHPERMPPEVWANMPA